MNAILKNEKNKSGHPRKLFIPLSFCRLKTTKRRKHKLCLNNVNKNQRENHVAYKPKVAKHRFFKFNFSARSANLTSPSQTLCGSKQTKTGRINLSRPQQRRSMYMYLISAANL